STAAFIRYVQAEIRRLNVIGEFLGNTVQLSITNDLTRVISAGTLLLAGAVIFVRSRTSQTALARSASSSGRTSGRANDPTGATVSLSVATVETTVASDAPRGVGSPMGAE